MENLYPKHADGKLRDLNPEESWAILEDLTLYDNESWNDPRDFAKPVKAIALPQDVPSTSDRRLIELKNQVQRLMEAHLALTQPTQVNKITTPCEICSGPYDTQYCMENPEQAFVEYASSRTDEAGGQSIFAAGGQAIPNFALGWHLEEIYGTWAHLEKKRTRLRTYTKIHQELCSQSVEITSGALSDAVVIYLVTTS
ncbi:hypothetical protein Tco_0604209 [Tanacetum coccineum]